MRFAVIQTGGKQYKVARDTTIKIEKIEGNPGSKVEFNKVMMIGESLKPSFIGTPLVKDAIVTAEIIEQGRGDKILVFKKKRRQNYRRLNGHKQPITTVRILEINKN